MASAPTGDGTIKPDDAIDILEELLPAQNDSYELGLKLKLPTHCVVAIHSTHSEPRKRLLHVVMEFLQQVKPPPTWRTIIDALKSPAVNHPQLAKTVEAAHLPDPTSTRDVSSESTAPDTTVPDANKQAQPTPSSGEKVSETEEQRRPPSPQPTSEMTVSESVYRAESPPPNPMTLRYVQAKIRKFEKRFKELKASTRVCLEKRKIAIKRIASTLTALSADDMEEHKQFLKENLTALYQAPDHSQLFGALDFGWNYLTYQLLEYLIKEFGLEVRSEMEAYKKDLQQFREKTPLTLFCQAQKKRRVKPSEEFQEVVAEFDWPSEVTLEVVEQFRQEYAYHYNLRECAMMLAVVRPGSFIATWFIPESIVKKMKEDIPNRIMKKYFVVNLDVAGVRVYPEKKEPVSEEFVSSGGASGGGASGGGAGSVSSPGASQQQSGESEMATLTEEEIPFVQQPSKDYFCPVTFGLLLQPHLTLCCGKHLSEEVATRIQGEGGVCPLCKAAEFHTVLNKHFQREVKELRVSCCNGNGCLWEGELTARNVHIQSCPMHGDWLLTGGTKQGRTELHGAAERGDVEAVQRLLTTSVNINSRTEEEGRTALHLASIRGHVEVVRLFIQAHALVNIQEKDGRTALYLSSLNGHTAVVELLLLNGANSTICHKDGFSPLYVASQEGQTDVVDILLRSGADVHQTTIKNGCSPLYVASEMGHTDVVDILLRSGADVHQTAKEGSVPLGIAAKKGHTQTVQRLLEAGANVNHQNKDGFNPLYSASGEGHTDIVDILLMSGADVHQTTKTGDVPLGIAAQNGHTQTVQRLLEAGANVNHQNKYGVTPVYCASLRGHGPVAELLMKNGADIRICDENGASPLYVASQEGHTDVVDILLRSGADVHQTTIKDGFSPLYAASQEGHTDVVDILLRSGADVHQTTKTGDVPLGIAAQEGHTQTVQRLLEAGANVNHQNKGGTTALLCAGWKGHSEIVRLLLQAVARDIPDKRGNTALSWARANNHNEVVQLIQQHK